MEVENVAQGGVLVSQVRRVSSSKGSHNGTQLRTFPNPRKTEALRRECSPSEDFAGRYIPFAISILLVIYFNRFAHAILQKISLNHYSRIESKMSTSTSVDASVLQEKSYSHKPPTRKPSDRLREKIQRESCARMEEDKGSQKVETIGDAWMGVTNCK